MPGHSYGCRFVLWNINPTLRLNARSQSLIAWSKANKTRRVAQGQTKKIHQNVHKTMYISGRDRLRVPHESIISKISVPTDFHVPPRLLPESRLMTRIRAVHDPYEARFNETSARLSTFSMAFPPTRHVLSPHGPPSISYVRTAEYHPR